MDYGALGKQWEELFGANAAKTKPANMQALTDWFSQLFGGTSTTKDKKTTTTPNAPSAAQLAVQHGPTAYSDPMRANLGFGAAGATPAPTQPSGMAAPGAQPYWSSPAPSPAPSLEQVLGVYTPPPAPTLPTPTTPTPTTPTPTPPRGGSGQGGSRPGSRPQYNGGRDG
jgi:hypothetical protein